MTRLSQAQLERRVEVLVINGKRPEAQAVIPRVGYNPAALDGGAALLEKVRQGRPYKQELLAGQKRATATERQAREAANKEMVSLSMTARTLFADDEPVLTALGLLPGSERPSASTAETLKRWRQLVSNAQTLDEGDAALLSAAGWDAERLVAGSELVENYAAADTDQQVAIQNYQAASAQFGADLEVLRVWYTRASRLIKVAIRDTDPAGQAQLRELLGLDL